MKPRMLLIAVGLTISSLVPYARAADSSAADATGFKSIFNGKDLAGWDGLEGFWSVKDGVISGAETKEHPAPQTFLIYKDKFANFELHYKYRFLTPTGNSGLQFRSKVLDPKQHRVGGYQADCDASQGYDGTIYDEAGVAGGRNTMSNRGEKTVWDAANKRHNEPLDKSAGDFKKFVHKQNEWNDVSLVADGNHVVYSINGHVMTDLTDDSPKAVKDGVLAFQLHAGFVMEVQFKDIEIKDLTAK